MSYNLGPAGTRLQRWFVHATESHILFPVLALVILGVIWAMTLNLISVDRAGAVNAATVSSQELVTTYEAQVVRALREIDLALKAVKYAYELSGQPSVLQNLKSRDLLPPDLLFVVSIAGRDGDVVASTRPSGMTNAADQDYFKGLIQNDTLWISRPKQSAVSDESKLNFSRRLKAVDGSFAGVVTITVAVAYFVSGYEKSKLGEHGVLGILGTDGVFRARRTGNLVSAGDTANYASSTPGADQDEAEASLMMNSWDGVWRYTSTRKLYDFPLAVIVGLSEEDQLAGSYRNAHRYQWLAAAGSALLMLIVAALARMSWQLANRRLHEIAVRKLTEQNLRIAASAFDSQEDMIITDADTLIQRVNRAFTETTGYTADEAVGKALRLFRSNRHGEEFFSAMWETVNRTGSWQGEIWDRHKNGEEYLKWLNISAVKDDDGMVSHYVGVQHDITERKRAEEKINYLAFFDQLTGLSNRTLLQDRLRQAMTASARSNSFGALLLIDLDNFKTLNDTLGHDMGDLLLKQVAQRLTECVRAKDTVARLGGDEFVVMLVDLSESESEAATRTKLVGEKVLAALNKTYQLKDITYHSTPSIGVSLFNGQQTEIDTLLKQSDLALYKAKDTGRNTMRFFDPDMELVVMKRAALESELREAVQKEQFELYYQAQMVGDQLTGAEVLIRWQHPQRGLQSPLEFIPLAEETGLILPLGHWVLETACTQLATWADQPEMAHLTLAVNVSPRQFHQTDFVDQVLKVLNNTGANPGLLKLELTESLLVSNVEELIEKMFALKGKGVGFALDDFGTGYSSLTYLKRLPLDHLKIDQSFVRDVLSDPNDASIVKTIIALAQNLGLGIIAEGVETALQRDFLSNAGCYAYQGYFFSRPLPLEGFEEFAQRSFDS